MPDASTMKREVPLGQRIRALMSFGPIAGPLMMPRGVRKFRSFDDLCRDRQKYEEDRIAGIRARRDRIRK